jgi:hypothetical protein
MAKRPTEHWRNRVAEDAAELAAGTLDPDCGFAADLWPESLITSTDAALDQFEQVLPSLAAATDDAIFDAIRDIVLVLNRINDEHGGSGYETGEREELCLYLEDSLDEAGIDVVALAARRGITRHEITDDWRRW